MEETIRFSCSKCGRKFKVDDKYARKEAKCPCGAIIAVPPQKTIPDKTLINSDASQPEPQEDSSNSESKQPFTKAKIPRKNATDRKKELEYVSKLLQAEEQKNSIPGSFIAVSIVSIVLILALSLACGAILTMPDKDRIVTQVGQIERDICKAEKECELLKEQIENYRSNTPKVTATQKRKRYGIDFSKLYYQEDGSLKQTRKMAAQLQHQMETDKSWTTDELLDQFSFESGFTKAKLQKAMDLLIADGKIYGDNCGNYEALVLAGLFLENEKHPVPKF